MKEEHLILLSSRPVFAIMFVLWRPSRTGVIQRAPERSEDQRAGGVLFSKMAERLVQRGA